MEKVVDTVIINNREINQNTKDKLEQQGLSPLLAKLFAARGINDINETFYAWKNLISPTKLKDNQTAAKQLADAIKNQKKLMIVADYDCDGATACAVAIKGLKMMGAEVDFFVPNRFETGYGLSPEVIDLILKNNLNKPDILITVDNGIASIEGVDYAKQHNIDVIVTDHHLPADSLPNALSIVNPNQPGCTFESKNLAGVGVIFYLLLALRAELRQRELFNEHNPEPQLNKLIDLVALGTVADVVKLDANNRILVAQGLSRIRKGLACPGVQALFKVASTTQSTATCMDLGFRIGPRINAAGRLSDMSIGIRCLISSDMNEAEQLALQLDQINKQRRSIEQEMSTQAFNVLENTDKGKSAGLCLFDKNWHQGVIGIVASRLKEKFYKPVFAFAPGDEGEIKGSGRSIPDVHLRDVLDLVSKRYPNMILKFGGHSMAAGLTLAEDQLSHFEQALHEAIIEMTQKDSFQPLIETDGSLATQDANIETADLLQNQIWGTGFPPPYFRDKYKIIHQRILKNKHLKLLLEKDHMKFDAIWFNQAEGLNSEAEFVYELDTNHWNGQTRLQLLIRHAQEVL